MECRLTQVLGINSNKTCFGTNIGTCNRIVLLRKQIVKITLLFLYSNWLKTSISLMVVMGITWVIGVLVFHQALLFVAYIFTIATAFQVRFSKTSHPICFL